MRGSLCEKSRNGAGVQEWPDGSKYEGEFLNGLKHGSGFFTWTNGESYKGSFYKDYRHGSGTYCWPDGSHFTGKFYLNRKEGYGVHVFPDGAIFKGLYHSDEHFGPGIMMYPDGRQDVGLWYRQWLLHLCTSVYIGFTLMDFPEHVSRLPKQYRLTQTELQVFTLPPCAENRWLCSVDTSLLDDPSLLEDDGFILPPGIETYSTDSDHLPLPPRLRQQLNLHFFNRSDISTLSVSNGLSLQQRMKAHIHTHRFDAGGLDWNVAAVLAMNRDYFGPKGSLELGSERLIREASLGNLQNVQQILRDGRVHPDVADARGHTALIAAAENCHNDVIHLLLDSGADVNKLNNEGMSALAVCTVLCYPLQSLHETVAERTAQNVTTKPETRASTALTKSCHEDAADLTSEMPGDTADTELIFKNIIMNQPEQEHSSEGFSRASEHTEESKTPSKEQTMFDLNSEDSLGNGSPVDGCISYSACSDVTEDSVQQMTKVLSVASQVSSAKTQMTDHKMSHMKTEHQAHWTTMTLLLDRGADPNASVIPMPVIFLAIKVGHVEAVQKLLECGARTDLHLPAEQKGLYSLHVAAGLPGPEGPKITELLLHAVADPDVKANDADETYELDKNSKDAHRGCRNRSSIGLGPPAGFFTTSTEMPEEGGRTPLHVACQRDTDYINAREVVSILLAHKASTNHLWSGHSPLSLAIASGNDLAVEELLAAGADPNLPLSRNVGSALCATANVHYNWGPHPRNRVKLVEKLIKAGADILMPVVVGDRQRSALGTAVDYAHHSFNQTICPHTVPRLKPERKGALQCPVSAPHSDGSPTEKSRSQHGETAFGKRAAPGHSQC
ncbi:ankyrin repeat and MYND domain-containing protein 1 isoform X2 [Trichomycterus rosablanca]|uniref:ankyrin repeat and MYND domain-containing protein 1 isoform X2 n=1 Tax=Trichomycterus rosablanca TaxID=2290929 RepID=UPI002F351DC1